MRLSVIFDDQLVMKDGLGYRVTLPVDTPVHAIQWLGDAGEIEYRDPQEPNEAFTDEAVLAPFVALWQAAHDAATQVSSVPVVPARISKLQAELQLYMMGELASIEAMIEARANAGDVGLRIYWRSTSHIERNHLALAAIANAKGWSAEQVDQWFIDAAQLT